MSDKRNLVLSRMQGEEVVFRIPPSDKPQEVVVCVVSIRGDKTRLGCMAGDGVTINRREVQDAIDRGAPRRQP